MARQIARLKSLSPLLEPDAIPPLLSLPYGDVLARWLEDARAHAQRLLVITGAGVSTASGIPDYRSPQRPAYRPLQHADFIASARVRGRYWARSYAGWWRMALAHHNAGHTALAKMQQRGCVGAIITQNVDRLHHAASAHAHAHTHAHTLTASEVEAARCTPREDIIELHGTIWEVECLQCGYVESRPATQERMRSHNHTHTHTGSLSRPDGDVEVSEAEIDAFVVPTCVRCDAALLKPRVVFFGGSIPLDVSSAASTTAAAARRMLLVGSTAHTFSCVRLLRPQGHGHAPEIGIINHGATRVDSLARFLIDGHTSVVLASMAEFVERQLT